ncbi:MAG: potassium channel family protein [Calditrichia bacterium]
MRQLKSAFIFLFITQFTGTVGYAFLEGWGLLDSFYMTIITITTTGFGEVRPLSPAGRVLTILLIMSGVGVAGYIAGSTAQWLLDVKRFRRNRMMKKIEKLSSHYIICGFGRLGKPICAELSERKLPFVVIELDPQRVEALESLGYTYLEGDATQDAVLKDAGIERAKGMMAVLSTDADNVFATLSARVLNADLFVVTRAVNEDTDIKLRRAGANRILKPYEIGAARMVGLLLQPGVVDFIDLVRREKGVDLKMEEVIVGTESDLIGSALGKAVCKPLDIIVVAIFRAGDNFLYNPTPETVIQRRDRMIAIGRDANLRQLNKLCQREII